MRRVSFSRFLLVLVAVSGVLLQSGGCGGGGGGPDPLVPPWPDYGNGWPTVVYSEGSRNAPVSLTADGTAHTGGDDSGHSSYYSFTSAGGSFIITIEGLSEPTDILSWTLYSDSSFTTRVSGGTCNDSSSSATAGAITCAAPNLPAGTYYLEVYNFGLKNTAYSISVTPDSGGYIKAPVLLTLETPHNETIIDNGYDYYYFVVPPGGSGTYKINLSSTNADMGWELYSDSAYSIFLLKCDTISTAGLESCMTSNIDHGKYYVKVYANNTPPGTYPYTITVTTQGCSEGSVNEPVALTTGYSGKVAPGSGGFLNYGYSYYTFTPTQNTAYLISLTGSSTGATFGLSWTLYSTPDFSTGNIGSCGDTTYTGDLIICRTSLKLTAGTKYYLAIANNAASANTYTIAISPFDVSLGCNSGGTTCYDFEAATIPTSITNNPKDNIASISPWTLAPDNIGTSTQGFESTVPKGNVNSYLSCFEFTATDLKWIGYSLQITPGAGGNSGVVNIYSDMSSVDQLWGPISWDRFVFMAPSSGTHIYEWCYMSSPSTDAAWVDDIELHY